MFLTAGLVFFFAMCPLTLSLEPTPADGADVGYLLPYAGFVLLLGLWARGVYQAVIKPRPVRVPPAAVPDQVDSVCPANGDMTMGETLFKARCTQCHTLTQGGVNKLGPNLYGLMGRRSGSLPNYNYTAAMKEANVTWTPNTLFDYLETPKRYIPGTKMPFAGIKARQDRADLCAYIIQMTSPPPHGDETSSLST